MGVVVPGELAPRSFGSDCVVPCELLKQFNYVKLYHML